MPIGTRVERSNEHLNRRLSRAGHPMLCPFLLREGWDQQRCDSTDCRLSGVGALGLALRLGRAWEDWSRFRLDFGKMRPLILLRYFSDLLSIYSSFSAT